MTLYFDDTNEHIETLVKIGVKIMDVDVHNFDLMVDYGYIDHDDDALAYAEYTPEERCMSISISDKPGVMVHAAEIIAHELIHCLQYQTGRLKDLGPAQFEWEDETIIYHSQLNPDAYFDLPWEKEAYDKQAFWATKMENRI